MSQTKTAPASTAGRSAAEGRDARHCWLVGGGVASLAGAVYLVRSGQVPARHIRILDQSEPGGSLDAAGSPAAGYSMRGSRMFGPAYVLSYELLDAIPSLDDPAKSITEDTFDFWQAAPWYDKARLVDHGRIVDPTDWGLRNKDRVDLIELMLRGEDLLGAKRIEECFDAAFFDSHFWLMWCSMFGFETWHSAAELRRYLLRFLRLFPDLETMQIIQSTRYNGRDSIVRPMVRWLRDQGVEFDSGVEVTDLDFEPVDGGRRAVRRISAQRGGAPFQIDVDARDLVIVTLGSMTAGSTIGSMDEPARPRAGVAPDAAWALWQRLAEKDAAFGHPGAFCGQVDRTTWITFTVTDSSDRFFKWMERFSGSPAGRGGLVTLKHSSWMITFHLYPSPAFAGQPQGVCVWWGYGLHPDRAGDFVPKTMAECSGREILVELFSHLGLHEEIPELLAGSNCIPCRLPYTTSQFMPRAPGDRPDVVPPGSANFAFVGQYCEIPHNVVYTVEYSIQSARLAVTSLLGLSDDAPPTYEGLQHPNALVGALRRILQ